MQLDVGASMLFGNVQTTISESLMLLFFARTRGDSREVDVLNKAARRLRGSE